MYPTNVTLTVVSSTQVRLRWENLEPTAVEVVVEMSTDGQNYTEVKRVAKDILTTRLSGLEEGRLYYFRLKNICTEGESPYSAVVRVNDEFMLPGGGTEAGQTTFVPAEGKLYRILNYATVSYNSSANINGTPKYLKLLDDGRLGAEEFNYDWEDASLYWRIAEVEGGYTLQHVATGRYLAPRNQTFSDGDRIGSQTTPGVLTITYVGDERPSQSQRSTALSFYRINSPANSNQQIRARVFANDWLWGSGTLTRADMIFTFAELDDPLSTPTGVLSVPASSSVRYYSLQGMPLPQRPHKGLFIEQTTAADGSATLRKVLLR